MKRFLSLLFALPLLASCTLGERSEEGYYGPFEMVIKAKDGAHVDDIIVTLAKVVPAHLEGSGHTYEATVVTSTDVPVTFPRGFVSYDKFDTLSLDISVQHPYYQYYPSDLSFRRQTEGAIKLSDQFVVLMSEVNKFDLARAEQSWKREGLAEDERKAKRQSYRYTARGTLGDAVTGYFPLAIRIGRTDLVDKYFPVILQRVVDEEQLPESQAWELDQTFRKELEKWVPVK